jgi:D-glycero-D-manno-heptose 1,7-bisphosphate phosphatase
VAHEAHQVRPADGVSRGLNKAAFIDRDGVINEERAYVYKPEDFVFIPGSVEALRLLQAAGYLLVVVTNQSGIARGLYSEEDYLRLVAHMRSQLLSAGVRLDAIEHCPHLPDAPVERYRLDCDCRKPRSGMIRRAIAALGIDPAASILVGDRSSDIAAGRDAGIGRCFLVRSGNPISGQDTALSDGVYDDLAACVSHVVLEAA